MTHRLRLASFQVIPGQSVVVPLIIDGLPDEIAALGSRWLRKYEFHMTLVSRTVIERAGAGRDDLWELVTRTLSGREVGPISVRDEIRRVQDHPDKPDLSTLVVMVDAPGVEPLLNDLSAALATTITPAPVHVTLYSTDPAQGIGIDDEQELAQRAPPLSPAQHEEVRQAIGCERVFGG